MPTEFCPSCGQPRTGAFRFCRGCGFDFDAAPSPAAPSPSQTQQLASAAKTVQNVSVATSLGGFIGLVVGVLLPGWLVFGVMTDPGLAMFVPFTIGPIVGVVLGQRITLAILSR
jgi:hypothetical protein